jgi:hypothetical protein
VRWQNYLQNVRDALIVEFHLGVRGQKSQALQDDVAAMVPIHVRGQAIVLASRIVQEEFLQGIRLEP